MTRRTAFTVIVGAMLCAALVTSSVLAKGPGGKPGGETLSNNLSVPTIMIRGGFTGVTCGLSLVAPTGTPLSGYELAGSYYVQGVHKWQAPCVTATSAMARAEWGDNLSGDAKLSVGSPIRVELGLINQVAGDDPTQWLDDTSMQGYTVLKLEPSKLDRESAYGTLATPVYNELGEQTGWTATAENLAARVFDAEVTFSVRNLATGTYVVPLGSNPTAEINATGKVVYGYNLRVTQAGQYQITFVLPSVDITGVDVGTYVQDPAGPDTVTLVITVAGSGGGKGGK